ncbi:MAG: sulfatase-like hydrolase/transferase, partial [Pirellulales bacterium]
MKLRPRRLPYILAIMASLIGVFARATAAEKSPARPHILIIFTDDQGYADLGCFGSEKNKTPRMDQLAREGTRFTNFYAQTVC